MKIYDKNGKYIGDLFEDENAGPEVLVAIIILATTFILVGLLSKWLGMTGYWIGAVIMAICSIWIWFKYAVPSIKENANTSFGKVFLPIVLSIIGIPIILVAIGLFSDLAANVFTGWQNTPFVDLVSFW